MDWAADGEGIREQAMRIVVLLLGLSALAERAFRAPARVRASVLCFLLPAEEVAWCLIADDVSLPEPQGFDAAAALRLAARFRALAFMLAFLACAPGGHSRAGIAPMVATAAGHSADMCGAQPFDTS